MDGKYSPIVIHLRNKVLCSKYKYRIMQFLLVAFDGTDDGALERRMKVREEHLDKISILKKSGEFRSGGAILDDDGKMIGSMIVYDFPDRQSLDAALQKEPYFTAGVWEKIEIRPFRMAKIDTRE
jgi:uncharacterized protein YciI